MSMCFVFPAETFASTDNSDDVTLSAPECDGYALTNTKAVVTWNKVEDSDGYCIFEPTGDDGEMEAVKTIKDDDAGSFTETGLSAGSTNEFEVKAYKIENGEKVFGQNGNTTVKLPKKITRSMDGFKKTNAYKVTSTAKTKLGCRYVWGASGPYVFDCSGFTCITFGYTTRFSLILRYS